MSDEKVSMSVEELRAFDAERARTRGKEVALDFMRSHVLDFSPCTANSEILSAYIRDNNLEWTTENLETAFEHTKHQLAKPQFKSPEPEDEPTIQDPLSDVPLPPGWDANTPLNTRRDVRLLDAETYRLFYHHKKHGEAFRKRINAIMQRGL